MTVKTRTAALAKKATLAAVHDAACAPPKTKMFADLETALDVLDGTGINDYLEGASDDFKTAATVETMADFKGNLIEAVERMRKALACVERLIARCP